MEDSLREWAVRLTPVPGRPQTEMVRLGDSSLGASADCANVVFGFHDVAADGAFDAPDRLYMSLDAGASFTADAAPGRWTVRLDPGPVGPGQLFGAVVRAGDGDASLLAGLIRLNRANVGIVDYDGNGRASPGDLVFVAPDGSAGPSQVLLRLVAGQPPATPASGGATPGTGGYDGSQGDSGPGPYHGGGQEGGDSAAGGPAHEGPPPEEGEAPVGVLVAFMVAAALVLAVWAWRRSRRAHSAPPPPQAQAQGWIPMPAMAASMQHGAAGCPSCGATVVVLPGWDPRCGRCGYTGMAGGAPPPSTMALAGPRPAAIPWQPVAPPPASPAKRRPSKAGTALIAVAIVVLLVGAVFALAFGGGDEPGYGPASPGLQARPGSLLQVGAPVPDPSAAATVTFTATSGASVTLDAIRTLQGGVVVGVPAFYDRSGRSGVGDVDVVVRQDGYASEPLAMRILELPPNSAPVGAATAFAMRLDAAAASDRLQLAQVIDLLDPGNATAAAAVERDDRLLRDSLVAAGQVERLGRGTIHSLALWDGGPVIDRAALDQSDRLLATWLAAASYASFRTMGEPSQQDAESSSLASTIIFDAGPPAASLLAALAGDQDAKASAGLFEAIPAARNAALGQGDHHDKLLAAAQLLLAGAVLRADPDDADLFDAPGHGLAVLQLHHDVKSGAAFAGLRAAMDEHLRSILTAVQTGSLPDLRCQASSLYRATFEHVTRMMGGLMPGTSTTGLKGWALAVKLGGYASDALCAREDDGQLPMGLALVRAAASEQRGSGLDFLLVQGCTPVAGRTIHTLRGPAGEFAIPYPPGHQGPADCTLVAEEPVSGTFSDPMVVDLRDLDPARPIHVPPFVIDVPQPPSPQPPPPPPPATGGAASPSKYLGSGWTGTVVRTEKGEDWDCRYTTAIALRIIGDDGKNLSGKMAWGTAQVEGKAWGGACAPDAGPGTCVSGCRADGSNWWATYSGSQITVEGHAGSISSDQIAWNYEPRSVGFDIRTQVAYVLARADG